MPLPELHHTNSPLKLVQLAHYNAAKYGQPKYQTALSAAFDMPAALGEGQTVTLKPGETKLIPTGLALQSDATHALFAAGSAVVPELQIRSRSGLSAKHSLIVLNSPATIDCDYKDEIKIILHNAGQADFVVEDGMRIAQSLVALSFRLAGVEIAQTERQGGFGSTKV